MVWYNDKQRGIRLGEDTTLGLSVSCTRCHHVARIRLDVALRLWGERAHARDIARDLRCTQCQARAACVQVISDVRPPWAIAEDPGGGFNLGPDYPIIDPPLSRAWIAALQRGWFGPGKGMEAEIMCNRYAADIRKAGKQMEVFGFEEWSETRINPMLGNAVLEVFPKSYGPVLRRSDDGNLRWDKMRWGLPGPPQYGGAPVTNIRNVASAHWRALLGPAQRCLVPFTAFSEYEDASPKGKKQIRWFAPPDRGMPYFAGIWRTWFGDYGSKKEPNPGEHTLFAFLTTDANELVHPVHAKAMPVILRSEAEQAEWLSAPAASIAEIQARALPADALEIVSDDEASQYVGGYLK
ncbi:MAG: SOS response-associated peptidase [Hyphomonadaceae bacterium]